MIIHYNPKISLYVFTWFDVVEAYFNEGKTSLERIHGVLMKFQVLNVNLPLLFSNAIQDTVNAQQGIEKASNDF